MSGETMRCSRPGRRGAPVRAALTAAVLTLGLATPAPAFEQLDFTLGRWRTFTRRDGLPSEKVFAVKVDGGRVWAGTENGLAMYEGGAWTSFGRADGLPHPVVLALDVSPRTGDLWIATMGGLARWSGGRIDSFTQLSSGLPNDFVHSVRVNPDRDEVWAATAMGAGRFDLRSGEWSIFTEQNTPMHEPWPYSLAFGAGRLYVGAWGGGVLELDLASGGWREYRDPDGEMEIDLFADDGPVHDVTSGVDAAGGLLWQASYFGLARYDGRRWRSYFKDDSGLASDFINFVRARGRTAWLCTDDGLSVTDGERWATYRRLEGGGGETRWHRGGTRLARRTAAGAPAHNFVLGADVGEGVAWVATAKGLSRAAIETLPREVAARFAAAERREDGARPRALGDASFRYARTPEGLRPYSGMRPYRDFFTTRPSYRGSGRDERSPEPSGQVPIGFIGPLEAEDLPGTPPGFQPAMGYNPKAIFGRAMQRGAQLAVDEANAAGGYRGTPFGLVERTDLVLWGQTSNELARFVYEDGVWGILSAIDSNHNHVLARAALKAEVPIVNAGSTDPTLVEHAIPWMARVISDDRQNAFLLLDYIYRIQGHRRVALLRVNERDGRVGVEEFVQGARRLGAPLLIEQRFSVGQTDFAETLARIAELRPEALVVWGNPVEAGLIIRQLRAGGSSIPVFGFDRVAHPEFLKVAGAQAEGVVAAASMRADDGNPRWGPFRARFRERFGEEPDAYAAHAYDGTNVLIGAIRRAGLNRARIRDAVYELRSFPGVSGDIAFDTNVSDVGEPWLAEVSGGVFRYFRPQAPPAAAAAAAGRRAALRK